LRRYETIFITHPELSEEELAELQQKINSILATFQGDLIKLDDWGTRKLTYEIRKNSRGHFFLMDYAGQTALIRELERNFRLNDRVLRFQTVRIGDRISPEALKAMKEAGSAEKAARSVERPEPPVGGSGAEEASSPEEGGEKV
jgi:small subunit ribosomal protein S6